VLSLKDFSNEKIIWIHCQAKWNHSAQIWNNNVFLSEPVQNIKSSFSYIQLESLEDLEWDNAAHVFFQSLTAKNSSWPLHVFVTPKTHKPFLLIPALNQEAFVKVLYDMNQVFQLDSDFFNEDSVELYDSCKHKDPMGFEFEKNSQTASSQSPVSEPIQKIIEQTSSSYLIPLAQSLDFETGLIGSAGAYLSAAAYGLIDELAQKETLGQVSLSEVALTRMCRGPIYDVIGGGFFRFYNKDSGDIECDKLLHQNAEMLWVLTDIVSKTKSPFLEQVATEILASMMSDFYDPQARNLYVSLRAPTEYYQFRASDFIEALPAAQRMPSQKFFGITQQPQVPRITLDLVELAKEIKLASFNVDFAPADIKNSLLDSQKLLRIHRSLRSGLAKVSGGTGLGWAQAFALSSVFRAFRKLRLDRASFETTAFKVYETISALQPASDRERLCFSLLQLEYCRYKKTSLANLPNDQSFVVNRMDEASLCLREYWNSDSKRKELFYERDDFYDHLGFSRHTLSLLLFHSLQRLSGSGFTKNGAEKSSESKLHELAKHRVLLSLNKCRRLGISAISQFWATKRAFSDELSTISENDHTRLYHSDVF